MSRGPDPFFSYLNLERLLQLLYDCLSVLQLDPQTLSVGHLSPDGSCSDLHWRTLTKCEDKRENFILDAAKKLEKTAEAWFLMRLVAQTHLGLWFFSIVLSLLHGSGHLVHGGDDGVAGLAHTIKATCTVGAIHLEEQVNVSISDTNMKE